MGAILNGIAYDGIFRASGATFLVFADYCRPGDSPGFALSFACFIYFHSRFSVGVGEDGPDAPTGRDSFGFACDSQSRRDSSQPTPKKRRALSSPD